jgi:hypothetical protein
MWVGVVVELDVVEGVELDPQAASTSAADATAVPSTASPLSFRFRNMIVPDLLVSTALVTSFDGWQKRAIAPRTRTYRDQSTASVMSVRTCIFAGPGLRLARGRRSGSPLGRALAESEGGHHLG